MIAQDTGKIKALHAIYQNVAARLLNNSPFTTARTAFDGYERLIQAGNINIGLDFTQVTGALHLMANNRTHSLATLHVADRRARSDYESLLNPQDFAQFAKDAFSLDDDTANLLAAYIAAQIAHGAILNGRIDRALTIAAGVHVRRNGTGFHVDSQDGTGTHAVAHTHNGWRCTCPDNAPKIDAHKGCKHVIAVWMSIKAKLNIADATPKPTPTTSANGNGRTYNRRTTCENEDCKRDWQECDCPLSGQLPEPARITTPENAGQPLTVAEQKAAVRNSLGIKQEAGRRTNASFENIQRW